MLAEPEYRHPFWGGIVGLHDVGKVAIEQISRIYHLDYDWAANQTMSFVP
jgi:hypothetical protein